MAKRCGTRAVCEAEEFILVIGARSALTQSFRGRGHF